MRVVFADTFYWIALTDPGDQWHEPVKAFSRRLGRVRFVTTEAVFLELLAAFAGGGPLVRRQAAALVRRLPQRDDTTVIEQTPSLFSAGLKLYENRLDKGYSLVDCISMVVMHEQHLDEILTYDHHFEQEGFRRLFR